MYLKFIVPKGVLQSLAGVPVEMSLPLQKPATEKYILKGRFAWASKPVKNPENGLYYIFCGIQFEEELPLSIQLELLAISAHKTLEKLVEFFYNKDFDQNQNDPLKQLSDMWNQMRSSILEIAPMDCTFWYYFSPQDVFIKNSMYINHEDCSLYLLNDDTNIREQLMEHHVPILESELSKRVFRPVTDERGMLHEEKLLSEWLFPLFDNDEFLGLAQFRFRREIDHLFRIDKMFWLCAQIGNYVSGVIKSEELKRDNDYAGVLSQIMELSKPKYDESEVYRFYEKILTKFTELVGEVPSFLSLFSEKLFEEKNGCFTPALTLCAVKNFNDINGENITDNRVIGNNGVSCCPESLLEKCYPHFCEANCSHRKSSHMYCVPLFMSTDDNQNQNKLIAVACFAVSQNFTTTQRLIRRIIEVSRTSSLYTQLCLRLVTGNYNEPQLPR
jgi:hypothetical protein